MNLAFLLFRLTANKANKIQKEKGEKHEHEHEPKKQSHLRQA